MFYSLRKYKSVDLMALHIFHTWDLLDQNSSKTLLLILLFNVILSFRNCFLNLRIDSSLTMQFQLDDANHSNLLFYNPQNLI